VKLKAPFATAIAIAVGMLVLLGYFLPFPLLETLRIAFLQWALLLSVTALLVGVVNLMGVHWHKLRTGAKGSLYSAVLILSLVGTFMLGVYDYVEGSLGVSGKSWLQWVFDNVQYPVQSSLMALLAVALAYACIRMLRWRINLLSIVFVLTVVVVLVGSVPLLGVRMPVISDMLQPWITRFLALAGARGILLGVALGSIATGLRVLAGVDRPYGG